jgi:hypothetical protein
MSHHAFVFDDALFHTQLERLIDRAFEENDLTGLNAFLADHRLSLKKSEDNTEPTKSALARLALNAFCDPEDIGVGNGWRQLRADLADLYPEGRIFTTGNELRHITGVYFQSARYVAESAVIIERLWHENRTNASLIEPVRKMLSTAAASGKGLLIEAS